MKKIETMPRMTMREFLGKIEDDTDVWSDYTDRIPVCVCPPVKFTAEGEKEFKHELDEIMVEYDGDVCNVLCNDTADPDKTEDEAFTLLYSLAGYCSAKDYERWFED